MQTKQAGEWYAVQGITGKWLQHLIVWTDDTIAQLACRYIVPRLLLEETLGIPCCPECERLENEWWRPAN